MTLESPQKKTPQSRAPSFLLGVAVGVALSYVVLVWLAPPSVDEINEGLKSTVIADFSVQDMPYEEAAQQVIHEVRIRNPQLQAMRVVLPKLEDPSNPAADDMAFNSRVTLRLTNIPASEALRYVAGLSGLEYTTREGTIYFYTPYCTGPPPLTLSERTEAGARRLYWAARQLLDE